MFSGSHALRGNPSAAAPRRVPSRGQRQGRLLDAKRPGEGTHACPRQALKQRAWAPENACPRLGIETTSVGARASVERLSADQRSGGSNAAFELFDEVINLPVAGALVDH
jgi:hypothetical protein